VTFLIIPALRAYFDTMDWIDTVESLFAFGFTISFIWFFADFFGMEMKRGSELSMRLLV